MSRIETICDAVLESLNSAILSGDIPHNPQTEKKYAVSEELEFTPGFRKLFVTPTAPHNWTPMAIAPVSEQQFGIYLIFAARLRVSAEEEVPVLMDMLEAAWEAVENMDAVDSYLFMGGNGDQLYDPRKLDEQGLFWSQTELRFRAAYNA